MIDRIERIFASNRAAGKGTLMPFVTGGFPSLEVTEQVIPELERAGASIIEIGIPFSDPIADGPVIAASMHSALLKGSTPASVLAAVARARRETDAGLVVMVSCSLIHHRGVDRFVADVTAAGVDGLIVPDADLDDSSPLREACRRAGLSLSFLVAPTTSETRLPQLVEASSGFIYLLARVGVTGETRQALQDTVVQADVKSRVAAIRRHTPLPIALGFGISTPEQVRGALAAADGAIVGSAIVRRMNTAPDPVSAAASFIHELAGALAR